MIAASPSLQPLHRRWEMKRWIGVALVLGAAGTLTVAGGAGARGGNVVETHGETTFRPNAFVRADLRFAPGRLTVRSGEEVTFRFADLDDAPHPATVVDEADLPATVDEVFNCDVCQLGNGHFTDPPTFVLNAGAPGLNATGDSLLFFPGGEISALVTAPAGTTLHYLCIIHPWMQGSIRVR
jgi:plastocyanin